MIMLVIRPVITACVRTLGMPKKQAKPMVTSAPLRSTAQKRPETEVSAAWSRSRRWRVSSFRLKTDS